MTGKLEKADFAQAENHVMGEGAIEIHYALNPGETVFPYSYMVDRLIKLGVIKPADVGKSTQETKMKGLHRAASAVVGMAAVIGAGATFRPNIASKLGTYEPPAVRRKPTFTRHPGAKKNRRERHFSKQRKKLIRVLLRSATASLIRNITGCGYEESFRRADQSIPRELTS